MATIHQPSTLIFQVMDQLYLLKGGKRIYSGKSSSIVPYMERIGVKVDYRMNPADFFMLEISSLREQSGYSTPLNSENYQKHFSPIEIRLSVELANSRAVILQGHE
jgi:ABC-type multidrug transport system ATPase subunit